MRLLLTLIILYLEMVFANYPVAETLIYSQIDQILNRENGIDPELMPCLEVANNFVLGGIFENNRKAIANAILPSPSGKANWTVDELKNVAIIIINRMDESMHPNPNNDDLLLTQSNLTLEELDNALDEYPIPLKVENSEDFINLHILETLHTILSEAAEGKFDLQQDTFQLLIPAVDISIWPGIELKDAIEKNNMKPLLISYLKDALNGPMQSLDNGKTYCVITPVGLLPQADPYYYIPEATKDLIRLSNNKRYQLTRHYSKQSFEIPSSSHAL